MQQQSENIDVKIDLSASAEGNSSSPASMQSAASSATNSSNSSEEKLTIKDKEKKPKKGSHKSDFVASVDFGENYYDLFPQNRSLFEFKTPKPSKFFQQPREMPPPVVLKAVAVFEKYIQRAAYEVFSIFRFIFAIVVTLLTEVVKLVVRGLVQPIIVALITIMGSHILQPVLVSVFNYIIQPYLSFVNNVLSMVQQTLQPWFMMIGQLLGKVSGVLQSFRLVQIIQTAN